MLTNQLVVHRKHTEFHQFPDFFRPCWQPKIQIKRYSDASKITPICYHIFRDEKFQIYDLKT